MKLFWTSLLPVLACLAQAASDVGHLLIYDPVSLTSSKVQQQEISPETLRLILALRLHVDQYHDISSQSQHVLQTIDSLTPSPESLDTLSGPVRTTLILAEGDDLMKAASASSKKEWTYDLSVSPLPSKKDTEELVAGFAVSAGIADDNVGLNNAAARLREDGVLLTSRFHVVYPQSAAALSTEIEKQQQSGRAILALLMPNSTNLRKPSTASYGSWSLPEHLQHTNLHRRQSEKPLSAFSSAASVPISPLASSNSSSSPVKGILPQCFSSLSSCQSQTHNCSGHGSCTLKYTDRDASDPSSGSSSGAQCFSCQCRSETRTNKDGTKKTISWGGPACQKKDVVAPFWLLAGFTIAMVFLGSWGIGLLYSMGDQELPSVIGSGVSGVPRR